MKTTVMLTANEGRQPSDIIEESFVTHNQSTANNLSSASSPSTTSLNVSSFMDASVWPINAKPQQPDIIHPLDSTLMDWSANSTAFATGIKADDWILSYIDQPMDNYTLSNTLQYPNEFPHSAPSSMVNTPTTSKQRRNSHRTYNRRSSSNPSVASVVSLTAHEPVSKVIDGVEHITFLYSHDRLVKEYTIRTDIDHVNLNDIAMDFRIQNAVSTVN
jgi:hypothetical protein